MGLCYCPYGASKSTSGFDPRSVHMKFFNGQSGSAAGCFVGSLSLSFHRPSILIFIHTLVLPEGRIGEILNFFGSGGILDRKVVPRHQLVHHTEMSVSIIKTNSGLGSYLAEKIFHSKCSWSFM